jgi:hypothetical protein
MTKNGYTSEFICVRRLEHNNYWYSGPLAIGFFVMEGAKGCMGDIIFFEFLGQNLHSDTWGPLATT